MQNDPEGVGRPASAAVSAPEKPNNDPQPQVTETGGPTGLEPTRYGDWEKNGRCIDF